MRSLSLLMVFTCASAAAVAQEPPAAEDLAVLTPEREGLKVVSSHLLGRAMAALDQRRETYETLKTSEEIAAYQDRLRNFFVEQLGGFPERSPLNPQITGTGEGDGYRYEKIIFESRPNFYVTAVLFLPKTEGPYPGVLVPCGHSANGKASALYQQVCMLMARNGMAALIYDPVDQGERMQALGPDGKALIGSSTLGHTMTGVGSILVGRNTATYRIWDGMRAIDYLQSRDDIDPERIGCTGNSGGGTLTSYLMALDPRIKCAAPSCYLTSYETLLPDAGAQDAEQNIHGQLAAVMSMPDYVIMRAPQPTLMCVATRDFFNITGAWDTFRQAKRIYSRMGYGERVDLVEADEEHGFSTLLRQGAARWMSRWLLGKDTGEIVDDPDFPTLPDAEMQCTPGGQVMLLPNAKSIYDINAEYETTLAAERGAFWRDTPRDQALARVRDLADIAPLAPAGEWDVQLGDTIARDGYRIEKLLITPKGGVPLPALGFVPEVKATEACLYLHDAGKAADAAPGGPIEQLCKQGVLVLAVDVTGTGEIKAELVTKGWEKYFDTDWKAVFLTYMLGDSYVGMRAEDIMACAQFLAYYPDSGNFDAVRLMAFGELVPPALHAAALEPQLFSSVRLERGLVSWSNVVQSVVTIDQLVNTVHGALKVYDLPDLARCVPAEKLEIVDPRNAQGEPVAAQ